MKADWGGGGWGVDGPSSRKSQGPRGSGKFSSRRFWVPVDVVGKRETHEVGVPFRSERVRGWVELVPQACVWADLPRRDVGVRFGVLGPPLQVGSGA